MSSDKSKSNVNDEIDRNLRRVFEQTLDEDVPDRFKTLLDQLRAGTSPSSTDDTSSDGE